MNRTILHLMLTNVSSVATSRLAAADRLCNLLLISTRGQGSRRCRVEHDNNAKLTISQVLAQLLELWRQCVSSRVAKITKLEASHDSED